MSDKNLLLHNHRGYRWKLDPQPTIALIKACLFSLVKFSYTLGRGACCFAGCRAELGHSWPIHQIEYYSVNTTNMGNPWTQINESWEHVVQAAWWANVVFCPTWTHRAQYMQILSSLSSFHSFSFSFIIQLISTYEK